MNHISGRTINRAVLKQTIQRGPNHRQHYTTEYNRLGLGVADDFFNEVAKKEVIDLLSKYIVFQEKNHAYWVDRYWYFDVDKYQEDLRAFGIDFAKAVIEPMVIP